MGRCEDPGLREVVLGAKDIRDMENSSKGAQIKYFKEDIWYKQNQNGYEGKAEALGTGLRIFPKIWEKLAGVPDCRAKQVLVYQLKRYGELIG